MTIPSTILNVSQNFFIKGGSDSYFLSLGELLAQRGHGVVPFCARSEKDLPSEWSKFFPAAADFEAPSVMDVARFHYSQAAKRNLRSLLSVRQFDVAHLHIYYGKLTGSILPVLKDAGIPIVQTVHDYKLICPVYTCSRDGKPCELCHGRDYWHALVHRCNRGSYLRSAISTSEAYVSRWLGSVDAIDRFVAVSRFFAAKMQANGIDANRITVVPNFVHLEQFVPQSEAGRYMVYFGRIERSKGIGTLIEAFRQLPDVPLVIVGEGSFLADARALAAASPNIRFTGFKSGSELYSLVGGSAAAILPAEAYENCPISILESFSCGRPVIGSNIGGIPELIEHGEDGYVFEPRDVPSLKHYVEKIWAQRGRNDMGRAARRKAEQQFSADVHYRRIRDVYESLPSRGRA
ncbi:glycosyltransferase family 4 protein [Paraburkholderia sp. Ac-20336]|uniref:glycosyltransferase family 4 protein n=1 Tax=Burkholderiaceae TaxID=119060 RepID=UPI001420659A|nr:MULTISPECIES: glycosyltransferase family 4 protein [Burkholderiaceae]MBN3805823.1 glycosyltransferase family 4 protein [Paraburkholderia sp. Ac-20336]MBN3845220.1 glycosyltransferase family 4 protein [Paraburkholderia sp. Ac-20342]NIF50650.1 glycosyltransferase family 4 protein [Burkholderia sp. Ax-1724]NIF76678.1 glycosyltransferase family 4 protein [Paraburkholderia sp. Cy-641]